VKRTLKGWNDIARKLQQGQETGVAGVQKLQELQNKRGNRASSADFRAQRCFREAAGVNKIKKYEASASSDGWVDFGSSGWWLFEVSGGGWSASR
jgi:hypothetical protein